MESGTRLRSVFPAHYKPYMDAAQGTSIPEALHAASQDEAAVLGSLPADKWTYRYAPGKWSVIEVVQHVADTERVFGYRALCFARGEQAALPGMDENAYQAMADTEERQVADVLRELQTVRSATMTLFAGFNTTALGRTGIANGGRIGVEALGFIIAGHSRHHMRIIRERYLS